MGDQLWLKRIVFGVLNSLAIILLRERELVVYFHFVVAVNVLCLFPTVPLVGLWSVIVAFPGYTHLPFTIHNFLVILTCHLPSTISWLYSLAIYHPQFPGYTHLPFTIHNFLVILTCLLPSTISWLYSLAFYHPQFPGYTHLPFTIHNFLVILTCLLPSTICGW